MYAPLRPVATPAQPIRPAIAAQPSSPAAPITPAVPGAPAAPPVGAQATVTGQSIGQELTAAVGWVVKEVESLFSAIGHLFTTAPTTSTTASTPAITPTTGQANGLTPTQQAMATQLGLLATPANVNAYLAEAQALEASGAIGPGSTNTAAVTEVQQVLAAWGYKLTVNGRFDQATTNAMLAFKQANGLHASYQLANGSRAYQPYVDDATKNAMRQKLLATPGTPIATTPIPTLPTPPVTTTPPPTTTPPVVTPVGAQNATASQRKVFVDYMPWFRTAPDYKHWAWTGHDPTKTNAAGLPDTATALHPLIGPYNSQDDALLGYHLLLMKVGGFDGADITWYGQGSYEDGTTKLLYAKDTDWAQKFGFNFSLSVMPDEGAYQSMSDATKQTAVKNDVNYLVNQLGASPVQQRLNGEPIILPFPKDSTVNPGQKAITAADWAQLEKEVPGFHMATETSAANYNGTADMAYGWVQLGKNEQDVNQSYLNWLYNTPSNAGSAMPQVIGVTYPGFNDSGVDAWSNTPGNKRVMDRTINDQPVMQQTWDTINAFNQAHPDRAINWVHTDTWNDWNEGTNIEPSVEDGFSDFELAAKNNYAFKGQAMPSDIKAAEQFALDYYKLRKAGKTDADLATGLKLFAAGSYSAALASLPAS